MTRKELINDLAEKLEIPAEKLQNDSPYVLVDKYLNYEGIIGFTRDIFNVISAAIGVNISRVSKNSVIINGKIHNTVEDGNDFDGCKNCVFDDVCSKGGNALCEDIFNDINLHFENNEEDI